MKIANSEERTCWIYTSDHSAATDGWIAARCGTALNAMSAMRTHGIVRLALHAKLAASLPVEVGRK